MDPSAAGFRGLQMTYGLLMEHSDFIFVVNNILSIYQEPEVMGSSCLKACFAPFGDFCETWVSLISEKES